MIDYGIPVILETPDAFLLVKETLTRIGIASNSKKTLYQTAHILHKRGEYSILHFKELFVLDGKSNTLTDEDYERRNLIVSLLSDWKILKVVDPEWFKTLPKANINSVKIISFKEKDEWNLEQKYSIGKKKNFEFRK